MIAGKKAVEGIEKRCKIVGDTEQNYLAIDFTNFLVFLVFRPFYER